MGKLFIDCARYQTDMKVLDPREKLLPSPVSVTQRQIAEELGVSRQLVSFALRGEGRMADSTRSAILEAARRGGYHEFSNREARAMASRRYGKRARSGILAVLFHGTFEEQPVSSVPFFTPFFEGLETEAIARGIDLVLCAVRPGGLPRIIREYGVDGVVGLLVPEAVALQVSELSIPTVSILYPAKSGTNLCIDDRAGSFQAVQYLAGQGHRSIAYVGLEGMLGDLRYAGYRDALAHFGIPLNHNVIDVAPSQPSIGGGITGMQRILARSGRAAGEPPFTALVCFNDLMAMGAIGVLKDAGWRVPEDVSVVGFDDVSREYGFNPALTSVGFPRRDIGRQAIRLLCEAGADAQPAVLQHQFSTELVVRDSTAPLLGEKSKFELGKS